MALPLWDPVAVPPDFTLVDINSIVDDDERMSLQAEALDVWIESQGMSYDDAIAHDWSPSEGMFALRDLLGSYVGIVLLVEVENA